MTTPPPTSPVGGLSTAAYRDEAFPALRLAQAARLVRRLGRLLLVLLVVAVAAMLLAPWQQSIRGEGTVIAFDPFERPQPVPAPVEGRIAERGEGVQENSFVEKDQLLFRIEDLDPGYLRQLEQQVEYAKLELRAARGRLEDATKLRDNNEFIVGFTQEVLEALEFARDEAVASLNLQIEQARNKLASDEAKVTAALAKVELTRADYERKQNLFADKVESELNLQKAEQEYRDAVAKLEGARQDVENARNGVASKQREAESKRGEWEAKIKKEKSLLEKARVDVTKANIDIQKITEEINQKQTKLLDQQRKVNVQRTQEVRAPRAGRIMSLAVVDTGIVKKGEQLCRIVPDTTQPAVQVWVSGNDAPLIARDDHVRLQFEGWPAVQFSGWPSVAVGTFGGTVALVDPTDDGAGKFRVVIVPDASDAPWPDLRYLRQGVRANGWVLLDRVTLGYEIWRRMNGFPPSLKAKEGKDSKVKAPKIKI